LALFLNEFRRPQNHQRSYTIRVHTNHDIARELIGAFPLVRRAGWDNVDADQELLLAALEGLTDEELCAKLSLSLTAIKKRWISIFERTIHTHPDLFPAVDRQNNGQKRSRQKRHHVLAYMRAHPEELRPIEFRAP
jgi:hypothetical protein